MEQSTDINEPQREKLLKLPYKPLLAALPSQVVAATILQYHGPFLYVTRVFLPQLSNNSRAYALKHADWLREFCAKDPLKDEAVLDIYKRGHTITFDKQAFDLQFFKGSEQTNRTELEQGDGQLEVRENMKLMLKLPKSTLKFKETTGYLKFVLSAKGRQNDYYRLNFKTNEAVQAKILFNGQEIETIQSRHCMKRKVLNGLYEQENHEVMIMNEANNPIFVELLQFTLRIPDVPGLTSPKK